MAQKLATISNALVTRLRLVFPDGLFQVSMLPATPKKRDMDTIVTRKPFVGLAWISFTPDGSPRTLKGTAKFSLLLVCQNQRSVEERLKGDARGIGLYAMVTAAAGVLHGFTIADCGAVQVTDTGAALVEDWGDDSLAMAALDLSIPIILDADPSDNPQDFLRLGVTWNLPGPAGQGEPSYQLNVRTS